jgi:hypothetical protein
MTVSNSVDEGSIPSRPAKVEPGLCKLCLWARKIKGKFSEFWYCEQSKRDETYPKYPRLPVVECSAYMTTHPAHVPGWDGSMQDLADAVASMRYDKLQEFLSCLAFRILADGDADAKRNRKKLAAALHAAGAALRCSSANIKNAWLISKPFMKEEQ